jgi:NAD(P)H-dependent nitrite reductase small subunit
METENWIAVCQADDVPPGSRKLVKVNNTEIALFNLRGTTYAIKNRCPHRSGPLIRGYIDDACGVKCPMHGWRFDLRDGSSERPARAQVYPVKGEDGLVYLRLWT